MPPAAPATASTLLTLRDVSIGFDESPVVLRGISFDILPTMRLALLGPNGVGKSCLIRALAGKLKPCTGTIERMKLLQLAHWEETTSQYPTNVSDASEADEPTPLSVLVSLASGALDESSALEALNTIGVDQWAARRPWCCLSSGERVRVAQSALALAPKHLLLLDEPNASLGAAAVESLGKALAPETWGGALVFATSSRATAEALRPTHTARLAGGRLCMHEGPPDEADWQPGGEVCADAEAEPDAGTEAGTDAVTHAGACAAVDSGAGAGADAGVDAATLSLIVAAISTVGARSDWFSWAHRSGLYLERSALVHRLDRRAPTVVVDVRDEDGVGGHIPGALRLADGCFGAPSVLAILRRARELATSPGATADAPAEAAPDTAADASPDAAEGSSAVLVVFHCMESARRAPRCARRLVLAIQALREREHVGEDPAPLSAIDVRVLEGGFDQWCRHFWADDQRVDAYDDAYWGYAEMGGTSLFAHDLPTHSEYQRPADQAATPWSAAEPENALHSTQLMIQKRPRAT